MSTPSVIDTNCIKYFQDERVAGVESTFTMMISKVQLKGAIAIDNQGQALQEYQDCCQPSALGLNLMDWIADQAMQGMISEHAMDVEIKKTLKKKQGLPQKDCKWPAIAISAQADVIITEDIDLFDPKSKNATKNAKDKIKRNGGALSKHLRKEYGVNVRTAQIFLEE